MPETADVEEFAEKARKPSSVETVEVDEVEYGHRVRVQTNYDSDSEDFKANILALYGELESLKEEMLDLPDRGEELVAIRIDWMG